MENISGSLFLLVVCALFVALALAIVTQAKHNACVSKLLAEVLPKNHGPVQTYQHTTYLQWPT
jgi:hypothetical protein